MRLNKIASFALSALLIGSVAVPATVSAKEDVKIEVTSDEKAFVKVEGTIDGMEKNDGLTLYTIKWKEESFVLAITKDTLIFDNTGKKVKMKKGDKVSAYTHAEKPMIMIYPPQYTPDVVIVENDEANTAIVGIFDDELVDPYLKLQLNVDDGADISSASGDKVKANDLKGKDLLVFYKEATRSIPAQTTPEKVVILDVNAVDEDATIEQMIEDDHYMVEGVKMVPLRLLAEKLGYVVDSTGVGAVVSKGAPSYTITRGQKEYGYNKSLLKFEAAPELLEPKKTYVPVEFIEEMMK
ncbi:MULTISPECIES: stalk domain-containing protein [unclassified Sporosarcina]|uniref:stalk domain-containing protein n=1 Tax=unclassified Sporosarcina TaxID=2647733 RepID=UPI000C167E7D|nr:MULTISPECIES: stalk domain-containing protein [unclassified Sporosarcina]PIC99009.1 copper amine oxidase [Sporosarcina sp. P29]PID05687.1 copper amine oxidase [Sporosarcina sp. P30]PID08881.1 copper amine oxidase [Sporosarcina sp. P31]PID11872.1 copper amine oxidase [Sporosarcina sp. P32b]